VLPRQSQRMRESPRPEDLGEQRTPVAPEPAETERSAVEPRSEEGLRGMAARWPYWIIVGSIIVAAFIVLYVVWYVIPPQ
jgi:hypothetical protein